MKTRPILPATSAVAAALCAGPAEAQWSLAPPDLVVGEDAEALFEDVTDVLVRDERVYVADWRSHRIFAFDRASGRLAAAAGQEGEGPGDFHSLKWIGDCGGDTIFASDTSLRRVSEFSPDLEHLRTFRLEDPADGQSLDAIECIGAGAFFAVTQSRSPALRLLDGSDNPLSLLGTEIHDNDAWRATYDIILYESNGSIRKVAGTFPGAERYLEVGPSGRSLSEFSLQWGLTPAYSASPRGFVAGPGETFSLVRYDADGNVLDTLALGHDRVAVTQAHIDAWMDAKVESRNRLVEQLGMPEDRVVTRANYEDTPLPSHFPAYSKVIATAAGHVWVERFPEPYTGRPRHWKVFAPDGNLVATVDVPRHLNLMWAGDTHVAGVATGEFGVETVEVRPIQRQ